MRALFKERRKSHTESSVSASLDLETKRALAEIERSIAARKIQRYVRRRTLSQNSSLGSPLGSPVGKGKSGEKTELF